jgi:hypothetical protein
MKKKKWKNKARWENKRLQYMQKAKSVLEK